MTSSPAIAVVGASVLFPGSIGAQSFWRNILQGCDFMTDVPPDNWMIDDYFDPDPSKPGKIYARRGGFLPKVDFDPLAHGIPPNQLDTTDTVQLLSLIVAQKVLDDAASVQFGKVSKRDISVILGMTSATELVSQMSGSIQRPHWVKALREAGLPESQVQDACDRIEATYPKWTESTFPGLLGNVVAGRIANRLDLGGANCVVDAACASSLSALTMAAQELQLGHSDLVITGGTDCLNDPFMYMCFSKTPALSPTGDCRPFSDSADGTMLGEGIGMLALRRLRDAERDGDKIYAVLRGIGSSSDGRAKSIYAPRSEGQEIAIRRAYERAGYGPGEVGLIEAHGTATKAGDAAEFEGLRRAFSDVEARQAIALGSIKSQIGHTKAAAGAASLFKVVMALHHKVLPPTIKVDRPNGKLKIEESPFYLNTEARPWIEAPGRTRKAGVSSFGFGGSNFHATLEEYVGESAPPPRISTASTHLLLLGAPDARALTGRIEAACGALASAPLPQIARESQSAFEAVSRHRLAVLAADAGTAIAALRQAALQIGRDGDKPLAIPNRTFYAVGGERPKVAFLFPGQGSQYVNMGRALATEFDAARRVWDEAATLALDAEHALHEVVFPIPAFDDAVRTAQAERLTRTDWAQPALGAASLAAAAVLRRAGLEPDAVAGHSYGEVVALHAAGVIPSPADMLAMSRRRGELMRAASSEPGAMMAVGASRAEVQALIDAQASPVAIANVNSPRQVVVAGRREAVEALRTALGPRNVACTILPVATAFHTPMVADSAAPFAAVLAGCALAAPRIPVYGNTRAEPYGTDADDARAVLARQLAQPVLFADMVERMYADGCRMFVEVGAGSALTGMVGDCLAGRPHTAVAVDHRRQDGLVALFNALAVISVGGVQLDFAGLWSSFAPFEPERSSSLSAASVKLGGGNYGKPYPAGGAAARPAPNPERPAMPATPVLKAAAEPVRQSRSAVAAPPPIAALAAAAVPAREPARDVSAAAVAPLSGDGWTAFETMQRNLLEAQKAFTETMAASHLAFLQAAEAGMGQLVGATAAATTAVPTLPAAPMAVPAVVPVAAPAPVAVAAVAAPAARALPSRPAPAVARTASVPVQRPVLAPAAAPALDVTRLLLDVVSEKTGYPVEMLSLDMELEAGLGIDSIKRVQILSALQEKVPELATVDANALSALNTLGEIVALAGTPAALPIAPAPVSMPVGAPALDVTRLLLDVVSEKTGYPVEMLSLDMELEAGLGIDSIKRVQILSALQEKVPELAAVDANALSALNTLGEIVALTGTPAAAPIVSVPAPAAPAAAPALDVTRLLLDVVSEKTGYPVEMLSLDMELEAGLGIDSIKRVQILSALQEKVPELAAVDANALSALNTLGEIVALTGRDAAPHAPAAGAPAPASSAAVVLETLRVEPVDAPAPGLVTPGLIGEGIVWIAGGPAAVADALAARLTRAGLTVKAVKAAPADARALIVLSGLEPAESPADHLDLNETAFAQVRACAGAMAEHGRLLVTVQACGGDFGCGGAGAAAWSSGIAALAKTAALEWPTVAVKAIDIAAADPDAMAERLSAELLMGGEQLEVGLGADGRRRTLVATPSAPPAAPGPIPDGVILVSGGARGVTAACLEALLERRPAKVAILGRTPLSEEPEGLAGFDTDAALKRALLARASAAGRSPTPQDLSAEVRGILAARELRANLSRLKATGAEVRYLAVDVTDAAAVEAALAGIRAEFGPIRALVHAAGVLADKEIRRKTLEQFRGVMATKAGGLLTLLDATRGDDLARIVCFSSVAAWRGNLGQCDYAMANTILNRVCRDEARRRPNCRAMAIGWGPWAGGMVDAGLEAHFAAMGVGLIPIEAGAAFFADAVLASDGPEEVLFGSGLLAFGGPGRDRGGPRTFAAYVHRSTHPYLTSHVIGGRPVVPMMAACDLALQAVGQWRGSLPGRISVGVALGQGMVAKAYEDRGDLFEVECRGDGEDRVRVRILAGDGAEAYRFDVDLAAAGEPSRPVFAADPEPWPAGKPVYDGRLFHGEALQVIERIDGLGQAGVRAVLRSRGEASLGASVPIDLLDGGLQLTSLWSHERLGHESLPTAIQALHLLLPWPRDGAVTCDAVCRSAGTLQSEWTLSFRDAEGADLAVIEGLQMHVRPKAKPRPAAASALVEA